MKDGSNMPETPIARYYNQSVIGLDVLFEEAEHGNEAGLAALREFANMICDRACRLARYDADARASVSASPTRRSSEIPF